MQRIPKEWSCHPNAYYDLLNGRNYIQFYKGVRKVHGEFGHKLFDKKHVQEAVKIVHESVGRKWKYQVFYPSHVLLSKI